MGCLSGATHHHIQGQGSPLRHHSPNGPTEVQSRHFLTEALGQLTVGFSVLSQGAISYGRTPEKEQGAFLPGISLAYPTHVSLQA